jgi:hypothetical protein
MDESDNDEPSNDVVAVSELDVWKNVKKDATDFSVDFLRHLGQTTAVSVEQVEEDQNIGAG